MLWDDQDPAPTMVRDYPREGVNNWQGLAGYLGAAPTAIPSIVEGLANWGKPEGERKVVPGSARWMADKLPGVNANHPMYALGGMGSPMLGHGYANWGLKLLDHSMGTQAGFYKWLGRPIKNMPGPPPSVLKELRDKAENWEFARELLNMGRYGARNQNAGLKHTPIADTVANAVVRGQQVQRESEKAQPKSDE